MSLLYKKIEDVIMSLDVKKEGETIHLDFTADCGKHGTDEVIDCFSLTTRELLDILQTHYED